ncbi:GntR family transcriptional regulator [Siccirubricoccus sp. KC 17139]|uniref:GntR family transcriptional regulator n=1 Tax=Siccirubricoccus soli TaxID=2899147 RepID=A0ABT1D876_9PROT|nr:GntR family transcriptional regulator [Siccirubricoccus soli]MCP2683947.1 GntR family transcriptional regulator [Siccirubricoccus soli]
MLSCRIPPGALLSEAEVMRRYELGRATCCAALHRLAQDGPLRAAPRQGYFVSPVTPADVAEIYTLRLELEPAPALRRAPAPRRAEDRGDRGVARHRHR